MNKILIIIICIVVLFFIVSAIHLYIQNNRIPELGHEDGALKPMPNTPNAISSQTDVASKKVEPLKFRGNIIESREKLKVTAYNLGFVELMREEEDYLYFVFTSKGLKFKDDVEFYLDESTKLIHIRSASRAGNGDLGVNLKRYKKIKQYYEHL